MQTLLFCLLMVASVWATAGSLSETPQQSLNHYVAFLNKSVDELTRRFQILQIYQTDAVYYRQKPISPLKLPSSGPLEEYYYKTALATDGLTPAEKQRLSAGIEALWQRLTKIDQTAKALETYVRLQDFQRDNLSQSDELLRQMQTLFGQFSQEKDAFYKQIQRVYRRYQPYLSTNAYLYTEKKLEDGLQSQKQVLDTLSFYLNETPRSDWPLELIQKSILTDEKLLLDFRKAKAPIDYPASDMLTRFASALRSIQGLKRQAVDDYTFAARQSSRHGNAFYVALLKYYNEDLLASHQSFVQYSATAKRLLNYPKQSPVFSLEPPPSTAKASGQSVPFKDSAPVNFTVKPTASPATQETFLALNNYVEFINESLRQMHKLQVLLRNYQSSAEYYRDPVRAQKRAGLTYTHDDYNVPLSEYQLLISASRYIPVAYRASINGQAEVLLNMLKEMDGLSIELITYTTEKQYIHDQLQRSDALLDRYAQLFELFDQKKERLYEDVRRIHESYPVDRPSSWHVAGNALLKTVDNNRAVLAELKTYLTGEINQLPPTDKLVLDARALIRDEYQNLKGLQRYGRNNGLCPYSPYEDLAENSIRFAQKVQALKPNNPQANPFESIYYFYNNELIYEYNKFSKLAKTGVLKAINQPDLLILRQKPSNNPPQIPSEKPASALQTSMPIADSKTPVNKPGIAKASTPKTEDSKPPVISGQVVRHDTVYVEHTKTDTLYVDRNGPQMVSPSLKGFATNNLVLLLDVSASMDSPYKLPLLKQSVKSLLQLLRPEDQVSIVVYSGKAKVALKPTSGDKADEIARTIDALKSDGDTDGNEGIRLAYKLANKNYIRAGNNRIVLATDGEFDISNEVHALVDENTRQDVYLTVFTFGRKEINGRNLRRIATAGKGNYVHITPENANRQLVLEAQAKQALGETR